MTQLPDRAEPKVNWVFLVIALLVVGAFVLERLGQGRADRNVSTLCTQEYAEAHNAADTAAIDRRVIVPTSRGGADVTCRKYRRGS